MQQRKKVGLTGPAGGNQFTVAMMQDRTAGSGLNVVADLATKLTCRICANRSSCRGTQSLGARLDAVPVMSKGVRISHQGEAALRKRGAQLEPSPKRRSSSYAAPCKALRRSMGISDR